MLQDTTLEDVYDSKSLAASIKGGGERASQGPVGGLEPPVQQNAQMANPVGYPMGAVNQPMIMMVPMDRTFSNSY